MFFTRIELHNYGIYKGTHIMDLQNRIGKHNVTLVGGLNGRGKTTLHDAVLIALYGRQALKYIQEKARSYERFLLEHINKQKTDDETFIAVSISLDDGTNLRVKRSWKENGKKVDTNLTVEKNGDEDKYLGVNWNYYVAEVLPFEIARFFFFNNEKITQLADDTTFEQIKESIKSAIGVTTIQKTIDHVDEVMRRKNIEIKNFEHSELSKEYGYVVAKISEIDTAMSEATTKKNELEEQCEKLNARIEAKEKEFWSTGGELGLGRDAIKAEKRILENDAQQIQSKMITLASAPSTPLLLCKSLVSQAYNTEKRLQTEDIRRHSDEIISDLYIRIIQKIDSESLEDNIRVAIKQIITTEMRDYMPAGGEFQSARISATGIMLFERLIAEEFSNLPQHIQQLIVTLKEQENAILSLDAHLGNTDDKTMAMKLYNVLKNIEREKALAEADYAKLCDNIRTMESQRETLVTKRTALNKAIAEKEDINNDAARIVRYAAMSIEVLNEFKIRLQRQKLDILSNAVTECFQALVEKDTLVSRILIDTETLDITLLDINGNELQKNQLSAGEQQMFAISIVWALALTSGYKSTVMIDTPLARLDSAHRTNFISKYLPQASSQVIVLSTDEEVYGHYLDLIRENIIDYYTLIYHEDEQYSTIVKGYFEVV